jgi:acyl-CoA thioester hydrolase
MEIKFSFPVQIQVRLNDVDILGHVSNTVYQNYYDTGKTEYFDHILPDLDYINIGVVGANINIDYLVPIYLKYKISVVTRISVLGTKSFTMEQRLVNHDSCEVLSSGSAVLVCYDVINKCSQPIPEHWRKAIIEHEGDQLIIK